MATSKPKTKVREHILINTHKTDSTFRFLKAHLPSFTYFRPPQPFSNQKGGQRQQNLGLLKSFLIFFSGGDEEGMLQAFFDTTQGSKLSNVRDHRFSTVLEKIKVLDSKLNSKFTEKKIDHNEALRLVSTNLSRPELARTGWVVSKQRYATSRQPVTVRSPPPNCRPLPEPHKQTILEFYDRNSQPAGNKTSYDPSIKCHLPARTYSKTVLELFTQFRAEHPDILISYSSFWKLKPRHLKQSKRKVDMCDICVDAQSVEKIFKHAKVDESQDTFNELYHSTMELYNVHLEIASKQRQKFNDTRKNPGHDRAVIVCDFKENMVVGGCGPIEKESSFYNRTQVTLFGAVVYAHRKLTISEKIQSSNKRNSTEKLTKKRATLDKAYKVQYVDYLSQILTHNALFVKDCLLDLTNRLKGAQNNIKIFDFWFDCGNHFRNYELLNFLLRELKPIINATRITVNFFCEHHGKSPVDSRSYHENMHLPKSKYQ